jgi:hypothetical protein
MPRDEMVAGYQKFVRRFSDGTYQYQRLKGFLDNLDRGNYIPLKSKGYGSLGKYVSMVFKSPRAIKMLAGRLFQIASRPAVVVSALRGFFLVLSRARRHPRLFGVFQFWLFNWTNAMLKYEGLSDKDFDIESVPEGFDRMLILPDHYTDPANEQIPQVKVAAQQRSTVTQLRRLTVLQTPQEHPSNVGT